MAATSVVWLVKGGHQGAHNWENQNYWFLGHDSSATQSISTIGVAYPDNSGSFTFDVYIPDDTVTKDNSHSFPSDNSITVKSLHIGANGELVVASSGQTNVFTVTHDTSFADDNGSLRVRAGGDFIAQGKITGNGAIVVNGGSFSSGGDITAYSLAIRGGSTVTLDNSPIIKLADSIAVTNGATLNIGAEMVTATVVAVRSGGELNLAGTALNLTGNLVLDGGGSELSGFGTITGHEITGSGNLVADGGTLSVNAMIDDNVNVAIHSGADLTLSASSELGDLSLAGGATLTVDNGAVILDNRLTSNGNIVLNGGAALIDTKGIDLAGGSLTGNGEVVTGSSGAKEFNGGSVTASGGTLTFLNNVDATAGTAFTIDSDDTLKFDGAVGDHGSTVTFQGSGALDLTGEGTAGAGEFQAQVDNFGAGDKILFDAPNGSTSSYDDQTGVLTIDYNGNVIDQVTFGGTLPPQIDFSEQNGVGTATICYFSGTLIRTPDGDVPVETLKAGDRVLTHDARSVPVCWIGKQTISMRFADPMRVLPIRIKAGALAENVPTRDLLISPDHAVLIRGALIQAGALVNGASIVREKQVPTTFVYYHVETDDHSLILAEGAPAETFVDTVDRLNFDNWAEHQALYPEGKTVEALPYPRAKSHRQVPVHIRVSLAERAQAFAGETAVVA